MLETTKNSKKMAYFFLFCAIVFEITGTLCLKPQAISSTVLQSIIVAICYGCSFTFMYQAIKEIPIGIVYATWSAVGIVSVALFGKFFYKQNLDLAAWAGISLIVAGVAVLNLLSHSSTE